MIKAEKLRGNDGNLWIKTTFRKNPTIFDTIRTVKGAMYDYRNNVWAIPYNYRDDFENKMGHFIIDWIDEPVPYNGGIPEDEFSKYPQVEGYSVTYDEDKIVSSTGFKLNPWADFQVRGFNAIVEKDFLILGDDMGLGKTFQIVTAIEAKKKLGQLKRCVVLAKASLLFNWRDEIEKFTDCKSVVYAGTPKQRQKIMQELHEDDEWTFLIMSYEMYRISVAGLSHLDNTKPLDAVVLDEAQKIKTPMTKIGQRIHHIPFKYKYVVTATPLPNTPLESFNYLKLGNKLPPKSQEYNPWKKNNQVNTMSDQWWAFQYRYAIFGGFNGRDVVGYKNITELREAIQGNLLRRTKKEKLKDLPDVIFNDIQLEMLPKQKKMYEAVRKEILEDLHETNLEKVPTMLSKIMRLQQVTGSLQLIGVEPKKDSSVKLTALDDLIEEIVDGAGEKVIVFTKFKSLIDIIAPKYEKYGLAIVHGDIPSSALPEKEALERCERLPEWDSMSKEQKEEALYELTTSPRQVEVNKFQNDEDCRIFLGSTEACKEGLTLTAATHVIFIDYPWNYASYSQAFSRAHRIGQKNAVTVHNLMCTDTVDEKVFNTIINKKSMSEILIDTKVDDDEFQSQSALEFVRGMV